MTLRRLFSSILLLAFFVMPVMAFAAEAVEENQENKSAMPQLDPTYFPSQWFWLVVCGVTLYVLMSKLALPRVAAMVERRDEQVQHDLEQAYHFKREAENLKIAYTKALRDADEQAAQLLDKAVKELKAKNTTATEEAVARIAAEIARAETTIRDKKQAVLNEVDAMAQSLSARVVSGLQRA